MKIALICPYSYPSICGVWNRVFEIAKRLKNSHEIHVFSSNEVKGTDKKSSNYELYQGIHIHRFPVKFKISENAKYFDFKKELLKIKPDLIDTHVYRHPHSAKALKLAKKLKIPCLLTTHAPFLDFGIRPFYLEILTRLYDQFIGRRILKKYNKIIAITQWEIPYLKKLSARNILYIPNGIPDEFFKERQKEGDYIFYFGRIAPIKDLETLIRTAKLLDKKINFVIQGPSEDPYLEILQDLVKNLNLKNIEFRNVIYDLKEKIDAYNNCKIFILPSIREGMPQSLIEAMSLGKLVIASNNRGSSEIIKNENNGFLFEISNAEQLKNLINKCLNNNFSSIKNNARKDAEKYKWSVLIKKIENAYSLG